jgi:hypothetical protein
MTAGYREFEFDLPGALLDHLVRALDGMETAPLDVGSLADVPEAQGVYQLFLDGELVYIGKTDAEAGLFRRLTRHSRKTHHRIGLSPSQVSFKAVRIFVFTAIDLETQLIRHYTGKAGTSWNVSGFGSNDPGRERDKSKPGKFDSAFPLDLDRPLNINLVGTRSAAEVIRLLNGSLPYTLRVESQAKGSRKPHRDLQDTLVTMTAVSNTARTALAELIAQLPSGWQGTALSAAIILYKEHEDKYPGATLIGRS